LDFSFLFSESLLSSLKSQLEEAVELTHQDLALATSAIQADLDRFQRQKVSDMRDMMLDLVKAHRDFCRDVSIALDKGKTRFPL